MFDISQFDLTTIDGRREAWLAALESGDFKQTSAVLRKIDGDDEIAHAFRKTFELAKSQSE